MREARRFTRAQGYVQDEGSALAGMLIVCYRGPWPGHRTAHKRLCGATLRTIWTQAMQTERVVIANSIINSPFEEPKLHFRFSEEGITDGIVLGWRQSEYFVPIAPPRKKSQQRLAFETWTEDRIQPNEFINRVRGGVELWRRGGRGGLVGALQHGQPSVRPA
jgi:hypothetical protein